MALGHPLDLFWVLTLREVDIAQRGALARIRRDHDELAWAVWHIAALPKAKRMPDLTKLQTKSSERRVPRQDWRAQEAILAGW